MLRCNKNKIWFTAIATAIGWLATAGSGNAGEIPGPELPSFPTLPPKVRNLSASQGVGQELDDNVHTYYDLINLDSLPGTNCTITLEFTNESNVNEPNWVVVYSSSPYIDEPNIAKCIVWNRDDWTGADCKVRITAQDPFGTAQMDSDVFILQSSDPMNRIPYISNITAEQRKDASKLVDIHYDLDINEPNYSYYVYLQLSTDGGRTFNANACRGVIGDVGAGQEAGKTRHIVWNPAIDVPGVDSNQCVIKVLAHGFSNANSGIFSIESAGLGYFQGAVYKADTGEPIEMATVVVFEPNEPNHTPYPVWGYYTDSDGKFGPVQLNAGKKIIIVFPYLSYYFPPKIITIAESSKTFINILMTNLLASGGGGSGRQRTDPPVVKEVRGKYCSPNKHVYYVDDISLQESFDVKISWPSNDANKVRWEVWQGGEEPKRTYEQPCSSDEITRTFDMGDIGVGKLKVVAVGETSGESDPCTVNLDVIEQPPIINFIPSILYMAVPTGEDFEYRPFGMSGLEIGLGNTTPDSPIAIFGNKLMQTMLGLKGDPNEEEEEEEEEQDEEKDHGDVTGKVSGVVTSDGKAEMFSIGWENTYKKETQTNVRGKKKIKLPNVEVSPSATVTFAFFWDDPNNGWRPGGVLDLGCDFMYASPPYIVGAIPIGFIVVPIYVRAELFLPLALSIELTGIGAEPEYNGSFGFDPLAKGILGAGLAKVACVEGYLGGGFHAGVNMPPLEWQEPYIVLVGGARAVLGPFSAGLPLRREWHNPTTPLPEATAFELMSRHYLDPDPCDFPGEIQLAGGTENAVAPNEPSYPYSVPDVVRIRDVNTLLNDDMLAVWLRDNIIQGDFEPDGDVNFRDFAFFANHWWRDNCNDPNWCNGTDLDRSGHVNTADLDIIAKFWLGSQHSIDRTELVYATYNSSQPFEGWSDPEPIVPGNFTADINPQLISFGNGKAACIWQDAKPGLSDSDDLKKFLSHMEIAACIYDNNTWGSRHSITNNNNVLDRSPRIDGPSINDLIAVWIRNDSNDPWGKEADDDPNEALNDIMWSKWDGAGWTNGPFIAEDFGTILGTALVYNGTTGAYVFCVDPNSKDPNDQELYIATYSSNTWTGPNKLTDDSEQPVSDTAPRLAYDKNGNLMLFWVRGNDIRMATEVNFEYLKTNPDAHSEVAVTAGASTGVKDFDLVMDNRALLTIEPNQMALVWSDASPPYIEPNELDPNHFKVGYDIWVAYYEPNTGSWSFPRPLTLDDAAERFISGTFDPHGDLLCIYDKTQTDYNDNDPCFVIYGKNVQVTGVPEPGRSDLYYLKYQMGVDLSVSVEDIKMTPPNPLPGTGPNVSVEIENVGEYPASGVEVNFSYEDLFTFEDPCGILEPIIIQFEPNFIAADGNCAKDPLVGGDQAIIEIKWPVPNTPDPCQYVPDGWLTDPNQWEVKFSRKLHVEVSSKTDPNDERSQDRNSNNDTASCETMRSDLIIREIAVQKVDPDYIITVRVANEGAVKANDIELVLRENDPNTGTIQGSETIPEIVAGAFYDVPFTVPGIATAYAIVDPNETIDEFNEENNTRSAQP